MTSLYSTPSSFYGQEKKTSLLEKKKAQWAQERDEAGDEPWNPFGRPGCGAPLLRQRRASVSSSLPRPVQSSDSTTTSVYQPVQTLPHIATSSPDSGIGGVASHLLPTTQQVLYVPVNGLPQTNATTPILVQAIPMHMPPASRYAASQVSNSSYTEQWASNLNYWDAARLPDATMLVTPGTQHQRSSSIERRTSPYDAPDASSITSAGRRRTTLPTPHIDDEQEYVNRQKANDSKQLIESQLVERRFREQSEQLREARESEQVAYERKLMEMRQDYERERELHKQKLKREQDEQRQAQVREAIERAKRDAERERHAKMTRHASMIKRDDDSGLGSSERSPSRPRTLPRPLTANDAADYVQRITVHDTTTSTDDDYNGDTETDRGASRKSRRAPSPPAPNRDDRPIKPQSRDPLEIWAEIEKTLPAVSSPENDGTVIQRHAKSRMSLRTPVRRPAPATPADQAPATADASSRPRTSMVKPPLAPKPDASKLNGEQKPKSRRRSRSKSKEKTASEEKSSTLPRRKLLNHRPSVDKSMSASSTANNAEPTTVEPVKAENPWADSLGSNTNPLLQPLVTRRRKPRVLAPMLDKLSLDISDASDTSNKPAASPFRRSQLTPSKELRGKVPSANQTPADLLITPAHVNRKRNESGTSQTAKDENKELLLDTPKREFGFRRGGLSQSLRLKSRPVVLENIDKPDVSITAPSKTASASSQHRSQAELLGQLSALREQLKSRQRQMDTSTSYALRDSSDAENSLARLSASRMSLRAVRRKDDDENCSHV